MKRVRRIFVAIISLAAATFMGCTNQIVQENNEVSKLSISLNFDYFNSRTIFPSGYDVTSYIYKLTGESSIGTQYENVIGDYSNLQTTSIELSKSLWTLRLIACKAEDTEYTNPILRSVVTIDLSQGEESLSFTLKPVQTGEGILNIEGTIVDYDYIKGCKITLRSLKDSTKIVAESTQIVDLSATKAFVYNKTVASGQYNFVIELYTDTLCTQSCVGNYSTIVVITNGSTTSKADITITNVLTKPDSPTDFAFTKAGNIVTFTWTDNAYNEEAFIIEIIEGEVTQKYSTESYRDNSVEPETGSFMQNSQSVSFALTADTEYRAKLFAVNKAGKSDACETELTFTL